ncbi:MAG: adenine phosphoribosyltransferase, partial [bacterium]
MDIIKRLIRNVPDFPQKGVGFKDITTLLKDPKAFNQTINKLCEPYLDSKVDMVAGIESRGFIFGGA